MKILLISIAILLALSSTVYADRYRDYKRDYNDHHSSKYYSNYGKHNSRPIRYNKHHNHYVSRHHNYYVSRHHHYNDDLPVIILGAGVLGYILGESH